jgi:hypothetical protein
MNRIPGVSMLINKIFTVQHPALHRKVFGIDFPNPVGLAAGFDKDAKLFNELSHFFCLKFKCLTFKMFLIKTLNIVLSNYIQFCKTQ